MKYIYSNSQPTTIFVCFALKILIQFNKIGFFFSNFHQEYYEQIIVCQPWILYQHATITLEMVFIFCLESNDQHPHEWSKCIHFLPWHIIAAWFTIHLSLFFKNCLFFFSYTEFGSRILCKVQYQHKYRIYHNMICDHSHICEKRPILHWHCFFNAIVLYELNTI